MAEVQGGRNPDSGDQSDIVTVAAVEDLLGKLPGVLSGRVIVNEWGAVQEVHILATSVRGPKQVVRDVESALAARWGLHIDHKKISVAQVSEPNDRLATGRLKLQLLNVKNNTAQSRMLVEVKLSLPDDSEVTFVGSGEGVNATSQQPRIAAAATIAALNSALGAGFALDLEDARLVHLGGRPVMAVLITMYGPKAEQEILVGGTPIDGDHLTAAIKACLQATNRLMEMHMDRGGASRTADSAPDPQVSRRQAVSADEQF